MSALDTAREFWGEGIPDWVEALAMACDRTSQNKVAVKIGRSGSLVSNILRARYPADTSVVEDLVRGHFMSQTVQCPVWGEIGTHRCRGYRARVRLGPPANTEEAIMRKACLRCPLHKGEDDGLA